GGSAAPRLDFVVILSGAQRSRLSRRSSTRRQGKISSYACAPFCCRKWKRTFKSEDHPRSRLNDAESRTSRPRYYVAYHFQTLLYPTRIAHYSTRYFHPCPPPITVFYLRFDVESRNFSHPVLADGPLPFFRQLFGDAHDLLEHVLKTPLFFRKRNS